MNEVLIFLAGSILGFLWRELVRDLRSPGPGTDPWTRAEQILKERRETEK